MCNLIVHIWDGGDMDGQIKHTQIKRKPLS
jgi:hypothetical protein